MAITEYVGLEDLDETYDDEDSHPSLKQITDYVKDANRKLTIYCGNISDPNEGIKSVGIELTEIKIHNLKVRDAFPGYQYLRRFELTDGMKETLNSAIMDTWGTFTHDPTRTPPT